jgi:phosphate/sulfate permease
MALALARVAARSADLTRPASSALTRPLLLLVVAAAAVAGVFVGGEEASARAVAEAGPELVRLLRGMALLKTLFAASALAGVLWRSSAPVSPTRLAGYALAGAAMAAGPGMIWRMDLMPAGAFLLHAGLLVTVVMLWRDPAVGELLAERIAARRRRHAGT